MQLFPEIEGEGLLCCIGWDSDPQLSEYSSLRKSIESSVKLFGELKKELEETRVVVVCLSESQIDGEDEWISFYSPEESANVLTKRAEELCGFDSLSWFCSEFIVWDCSFRFFWILISFSIKTSFKRVCLFWRCVWSLFETKERELMCLCLLCSFSLH